MPSQTNILATYKQIEAGKKFTIALREDGTVWAWGDNTYGQLGQGNRVSAKKPVQVQNLTNIVSVAAGDNHAIAIDKLGNVYTWGLNSKGQLGNRTTETDVTKLMIQAGFMERKRNKGTFYVVPTDELLGYDYRNKIDVSIFFET